MSEDSSDSAGATAGREVTARVTLNLGGEAVEMSISVPDAMVDPVRMLPVFRAIAHGIVDTAVEQEVKAGREVSCKAGCGACCRQLVPVSELEARQLAELVAALPEPRQAEVRERFRAALRRLDVTGMLGKLRNPDRHPDYTHRALGIEYFQLGIPCPFLEEESCSIHPDRPISCREYLVTSPPKNCARPTADSVRQVTIAGKMSNAVIRLAQQRIGSRFIPYVPMILALEFAARHTRAAPVHAPAMLKRSFELLLDKSLPDDAMPGPPTAGASPP